jgi:CheY-like chemotaxis protein
MATVLVVDDESEVRTFVGRVLRPLGHEVHEAADGTEALRVLERGRVDVVLADVYMAEMDGMEMLVRIQQRGLQLPVVMISGGGHLPSGEVLKMAAACGAVATLEKPFSPAQLREVVDRLLPHPKSGG